MVSIPGAVKALDFKYYAAYSEVPCQKLLRHHSRHFHLEGRLDRFLSLAMLPGRVLAATQGFQLRRRGGLSIGGVGEEQFLLPAKVPFAIPKCRSSWRLQTGRICSYQLLSWLCRCCAPRIRRCSCKRVSSLVGMIRREDPGWDVDVDARIMRQTSPTYAANKDPPVLRGQHLASGNDDIESPKVLQDFCADKDEELRETRTKRTLFGVELSPDIVAISMVYFVQGILGLSRLAVSFFLKDDLQLSPAETALLSGVSAFPWLVKPIYGFVSDGLPLFGFRRRSYLVLCGFLGAIAWGALATFVDSKYTAVLAIFLSSMSVAFSDVVVDSMVVERARGESQGTAGSLQSLCWGSSAVGGIVSAYFSGYLVESYGVRFVFGVTALLPLITSAVAGLVQEESCHAPGAREFGKTVSGSRGASAVVELARVQMGHLWRTVKEPNIFLPTLFIFLWQATPTSDTAMFYFTTNKLSFGPEFLGRVRLVTSVASLVGVGVYNTFLKNVPLHRMFFWSTVIGSGLGMTQLLLVTGANRVLGVSDQWFAMGDSLFLTILGQVSFMPILVLAARLCPPGVEATLFATLMSISNGAGVTGGLMGAGLTQLLGVTGQNFDHLAILVVLCNLSSLLPLPFLGLLPSESDLAAAVEKADRAFLDMEESKQL